MVLYTKGKIKEAFMTQKIIYNSGQIKIMEAAKKVIAEKGIAGATMRAIAEAAELSTGAIYHYYSKKEEVLYDVMSSSLSASSEIVEKSESQSYSKEQMIEDILENINLRFDKRMDNRIQLYLALEAIQGNTVLSERFSMKYKDWIESDVTLMNYIAPEQSQTTQAVLATVLLAAIDGLVLQMELGVLNIEREQVIELFRVILESHFTKLKDNF